MVEARVERRLAAILTADVAGYSRLMGVDEEGTLAALNACRRELIDPKIAEHRGRIVKTTGDGALVEFASAVDAVRCAMEIQRAMAERNAALHEDRRIEFRVGINVGDIITDKGDIYGDGVNVAARLEGAAEPGGICISGTVQEYVRGKLDAEFDDMGVQTLKNIAKPIHVYRVALGPTHTKGATTLPLPDKPSIAVLPFQNMSGDSEQDYFCDGMVEDIITGLSRIKWLFVIARNSSFVYKGKLVDVKQVGRELGVRYVLEGSVRKAANRVRITGQLIEAQTGAHLWAERYDRPLDDIFAVQDEITFHVVGAIEPNLRKAEIDRVKRQRPNNLNAYDLVLRSLPFVFTAMPREAEKAIPLLEDALKLDPNYSAAHAYLSWCLHAQARFHRGELHKKVAAIHHARAAIALGANDATALAIAAWILAQEEHDTATALKLFDRALELSNSNEPALGLSAVILAWMGKTELAIERAQRALRLNPLNSFNFRSNAALAIAYFHTKRYGDAADAARSAIDANPSFGIIRAILAAALTRLGRVDEAKAAARGLLEREPSWTVHGQLDIMGFEPTVSGPFADAWREIGLPE